jgi:hypothetical protein
MAVFAIGHEPQRSVTTAKIEGSHVDKTAGGRVSRGAWSYAW